VPAEAIFEFDARCPGCGEVLILEDDEDEFVGDESGVEFDFRERPTLTDEDEGDYHQGFDSFGSFDADEEPETAFSGHSSPFQGIGMNDQAGMDILALAASALDPDVDLSEHQFGGVREVPEVRLGESGEVLAPTDSDRLRRLRTGSGRLPKSSDRLRRQPKSSDRLRRQPKSSDRLQRQTGSGRLRSQSGRQTRTPTPVPYESGVQSRSDSGPLRPLNDSSALRREVEALKESLEEDSLRKTGVVELPSSEDALLAAAELYRPSQRLSFDELPPESDESALIPAAEEEALVAPAREPGSGPEPEPETDVPPGETAEMFRPRESVALLRGEAPTAPPLPSWEGGDTQQVGELAQSDPGAEELLPPLLEQGEGLAASAERAPIGLESDPTGEPLPQERADERGVEIPHPDADLDEISPLVELTERSSSGRMSRVYDASQVVGADGQVTLPPDPVSLRPLKPPALSSGLAETIPPSDEGPIPPPSGANLILASEEGWGPETEERISQLFQDADWLALLDDTLTEVEDGEEDEDGRRVIRLSQTTAAETVEDPERMRQAQSTLERDGAAALEALLLGSTSSSDSRAAQRFPKDALQPPTTEFSRGDVNATKTFKSDAEDASTQSFNRDEPKTQVAAKPKQPINPDTQVWSNSEVAPPPKSAERKRSSSRLRALSPSEIRPRMVVERFHRSQLDPGLVCVSDLEAPESDLFRQLYEQVFHGGYSEDERERGRVILVTSARPGEGKTIVASNLAVVGARVPGEGAVLINADPRGRGILPAFGQRTPTEGLLEALSTDRDPTRFVVRLRLKELDVIPLGLRGSNAAELIASDSMRTFIENLRRVYPRQSILIDGSSVLGAADPLALARMVDKVLLVVRARKTSKADVEQAVRLIGKSRLAGIVLNDATEAA
jgi:Mrp family chromosome partitioning ATPase